MDKMVLRKLTVKPWKGRQVDDITLHLVAEGDPM